MKAYEYVIRSSHPLEHSHIEVQGVTTCVLFQHGPDLRPGKLGTQRYLAIRDAREVDDCP